PRRPWPRTWTSPPPPTGCGRWCGIAWARPRCRARSTSAVGNADRHRGDREPAHRGLLVALVHVPDGLAHRLDDGVQGHHVLTGAPQRETGGGDGLDRGHRIVFDARD